MFGSTNGNDNAKGMNTSGSGKGSFDCLFCLIIGCLNHCIDLLHLKIERNLVSEACGHIALAPRYVGH